MSETLTLPNLEDLPLTPAEAGELLDEKQLGHLRHIDNMSRLPDNDWSGMLQRFPTQDDGATLRYQIGYSAFALALAHKHRLPAAPGLFKPTMARLFDKLLLPSVWMYWRDVSRAGGMGNASIQMAEEWNPVVRDNIMYSAYVQSTASIYGYLFGDDRFSEPESIVFENSSPFWGGSDHRFAYDQDSLNEHLYWLMVEKGFLGIACMPDCVFQVCIQPTILGFRLRDLVAGTTRAAEATRGYRKAWADFGQIDQAGHFNTFVQFESKQVVAAGDLMADAWLGSLLNMWNPELSKERYGALVSSHVYRTADGSLAARPSPAIPGLEALEIHPQGWMAGWASEMGDRATLNGLLAYADGHLGPAWQDGGLYYPRHDEPYDSAGDPTLVDPMTGNVNFAYARLNIANGLWRLYNEPLSADHHSLPALVEVARDVDVSQAVYSREENRLTFTVRRRSDLRADPHDGISPGCVTVGRLKGLGSWELRTGGQTVRAGDSGDTFTVACPEVATTFTVSSAGSR